MCFSWLAFLKTQPRCRFGNILHVYMQNVAKSTSAGHPVEAKVSVWQHFACIHAKCCQVDLSRSLYGSVWICMDLYGSVLRTRAQAQAQAHNPLCMPRPCLGHALGHAKAMPWPCLCLCLGHAKAMPWPRPCENIFIKIQHFRT
jgi:hypothetical protein